MSDEQPALSVDANYDDPSGVYVGGSVVAGAPLDEDPEVLQAIEYAGYARRLSPDVSVDVGATNTSYTGYYRGSPATQYQEVYAGVSLGLLGAYVYYAPDYFGQGDSTLYAELKAAFRPAPNWRLNGRVGLLNKIGGPRTEQDQGPQYDLSIGISREFKGGDLHAAWTYMGPHPDFRDYRPLSRGALVVGATWFF